MEDAPVEVEWASDPGAAEWIRARLAPFGQNTITSVVPGGFEAYARVLHPVETDPFGVTPVVRWADVARWSGLPMTPGAQFYEIAIPAGVPEGPAPGAGSHPWEGTLCRDDTAALIDLLRGSAGDGRCWFALWEGYGWDSATMLTLGGGKSETTRLPDPIPREVRDGPQVELPSRRYLLYSGDLDGALAWVPSQHQTPNLWWPDDRSWCVASEIDLPWTYIGGPRPVIDRILADERIEALPAEPDDGFQLRARGHIAQLIDEITAELFATGRYTRETPRGTVTGRLTLPNLLRRGRLELGVGGRAGGTAYLDREPADRLRERVRGSVERRICLDLPRA